jgi:hypothetical protein
LDWLHDDCEGEAVYCLEPPCENFESCVCRACGPHNYVKITNMSAEYNGQYQFDYGNGYLEGNRPVFQRNGNCVWWHRQYRHWWVGPCENVGLNDGYAYLEGDNECPASHKHAWRRGGSDEIILDAMVYWFAAASAGGDKPIQSSGTAGVNAIIRNGRYTQMCHPVYRNGRFKCPKTRN